MFGLFKLSGAPPKAFSYYRSIKDNNEKAILEDLYKAYNGFIKESEAFLKQSKKLGATNFDDYEYQKMFILSSAFDDLCKYGIQKGYSEFHISLFHQL
ncbi:hypothetical protein V7146_16190 [Gottfriedia acidiceleris]|uniref:hypothetical protein n=1 Tax=Gottfriedia acidiceleris TaxID=371036 RepID=UPI002FFE8E21